MNSPVVKINERGHFIGSEDCNWFLHHHVGEYCVSSIGDYHPHKREWDGQVKRTRKPQPLGMDFDENNRIIDKFYETMIFKLVEQCQDGMEGDEECNCPHGSPPDFWTRRYTTPEIAEMSHLAAVEDIKAGTWKPEQRVIDILTEAFGLKGENESVQEDGS